MFCFVLGAYHFEEGISVFEVSWEAVDEEFGLSAFLHGVLEEVDRHRGRHDLALLHHLRDLVALGGAGLDEPSQQVARAEVNITEGVHDLLALRPFARSRAAEDEDHGVLSSFCCAHLGRRRRITAFLQKQVSECC